MGMERLEAYVADHRAAGRVDEGVGALFPQQAVEDHAGRLAGAQVRPADHAAEGRIGRVGEEIIEILRHKGPDQEAFGRDEHENLPLSVRMG